MTEDEENLLCWRGLQAYFNNKANRGLGMKISVSVKTHDGKQYVVLCRNLELKYYSIPLVLRVYRVRTQGNGMLKMLKQYPKEFGTPINSTTGEYWLKSERRLRDKAK
jgi:hypothetical protein